MTPLLKTKSVAAPGLPWKDAQVRGMRRDLATWYRAARRDLPWRHTRDPYALAVSEFMLQQTQVITVIPYYQRWLELFPDWQRLSLAKEEDVIKAWEGLGYYRRARNLQALARSVAAAGGEVPQSREGLLSLPGVGPYTSAAIGSFAFDLPLAVLDGNVMRVLTRLLALSDDISVSSTRDKLQRIADEFLERSDPATHNQAIMELGATICVPRKPLCLFCPLKQECRGKSRAEDFPVKTRIAQVKREETVAILQRGDQFYCEQVPEGKPWHGLWRFPDFDPERMKSGELIHELKYGITKYSVKMRVITARWKSRRPVMGRYLTLEKMTQLALAAPHKKLTAFLSKP